MGQHIDKLSKAIGNVEEVKILMHKIPLMESKQRFIDKDIINIQRKVSKLETKMGNLDKLFKQLTNNVSNLLKRNEFDKG